MNIKLQSTGISRRSIVFFGACLGLANSSFARIVAGGSSGGKAIAATAPFVFPKLKWSPSHLHDFIKALPNEARLKLKKTLGLLPDVATVAWLETSDQDAKDIQKEVLWLSSNILSYPFKSASDLDYHSLVSWVSVEAGVSKPTVNSASTFTLERELLKKLFAQLWNKMTAKQREDLLTKVDSNGQIKDKAAMAAMGGVSALAALSTTVFFSGFAFYTTMSSAIKVVAAVIWGTAPMATYIGASTLVGFLTGPVGWAIMGLSAIGGMALAGRANLQKTTAFVAQIHEFKVEALESAGIPEKSIFTK